MADALPALLRRIDALEQDDLLRLHREVCSRAAKVYGQTHAAKQEANYRTAMAHRDTRFVKGLSVRENIERSYNLGRGEEVRRSSAERSVQVG